MEKEKIKKPKRRSVGEPFWYMVLNAKSELEPRERTEVEEVKGAITMSFNEALFTFGNYFYSKADCQERIDTLELLS